ncbi:MAG: hypothetical protein ABR564_07470 [Candidatus Dormibacteria bacterium]
MPRLQGAVLILLCLLIQAAQAPPAAAAEPWWTPVAFRGQPVTGVGLDHSGGIVVRGPAGSLRSTDGGMSFQPAPHSFLPPGGTRSAGCTIGMPCQASQQDAAWRISAGRVVHVSPAGAVTVDPRAPELGRGAELIAAPAVPAGALVVVAENGVVWRRRADGSWSRSLLLLPRSLIGGVPTISSIAAFTLPVTGAVYLGTDGYSVLISNDGGDDWIRAGAGLPDRVLSLASDSTTRSIYAGTDDGLWVHHLQRLPAAPEYQSTDLWGRWLGVLIVDLTASAGALGFLWWAGGRPVRPAE